MLKFGYDRRGNLQQVINPSGKKPSVYIFQGSRAGFSVAYVKSHRRLPITSRNAEGLAKKLASSGHKKVIFRD